MTERVCLRLVDPRACAGERATPDRCRGEGNAHRPEELQGAGANDQHGHRPRGRRAAPAR